MSRQNRSTLWLWTELPTIMLPLLVPLYVRACDVLPEHFHRLHRFIHVTVVYGWQKRSHTVLALLSVEQCIVHHKPAVTINSTMGDEPPTHKLVLTILYPSDLDPWPLSHHNLDVEVSCFSGLLSGHDH